MLGMGSDEISRYQARQQRFSHRILFMTVWEGRPKKCEKLSCGKMIEGSYLRRLLSNKTCNFRRKFRSQTSDNMDRWKAEMGRVSEEQRREKEGQKRESPRRKKIQVREKVGKSRNTVFFQWFVAPEGRRVGSLKRRVRSHVVRWEMKNCTPLWREAHFEVKLLKTQQARTTFGSWDVQKVFAVVARSTFRSQNVQNTSASEYL